MSWINQTPWKRNGSIFYRMYLLVLLLLCLDVMFTNVVCQDELSTATASTINSPNTGTPPSSPGTPPSSTDTTTSSTTQNTAATTQSASAGTTETTPVSCADEHCTSCDSDPATCEKCHPEYVYDEESGICQNSTLLEDEFLLFVDTSTDTVYQVDKNGNNLFKIELPASVRLATPRGLHYDPLEKKIYIADNEARRIVRCNLNGTDAETLFYLPAVSRPEGIAVDATAKLFFYTDTGTDSIMVSNFHGNVTKTIFRSAHQPRSIRVDTVNRHLYWTDWGKKAVYRSNYNGQEISKYLNPESNSKLAAVTLDNNERKVYWVDSGLSTIKMAAMPPAVRPGVLPSGSDTEAPAPSSAQLTFDILLSHNISEEVIMYGLASHEKYLYYYINRDGASTINRFNKETNTTIQFLDLDSINVGPEVYEMLYYDSTEQLNNATDNGCMVPPGGSDDDANGGCSHLCLPLAQSSICACPDDRRLESDGHTCTTELTFQGPELIWLEFDGMFMGYIRGAIGDPTDFLNTGPLLSWTVRSDRWHFTAADIDYENSRLVMFDRFDRLLVYLTLAGQKRISHLSYGMSTEVYGLAVDWRSRNIYWTDALYNWIMVTKMSDSINDDTRAAPPSKIIYRHLERPHGIALYPSKGILVWSDWGSDPRIEIGSLDGSEDSRRVLVNSRLNNPKGLTIDYATDTLFWVNHDTIEAIQLDGSNRRFLGSQYGNNYQAIAVFGNYLMATDLGQGSATYPRALWFYRIDAPGAVGQRLPLRRRPYSVMMYDESRQPGGSTDAPCQQLSCEHLCVSSANDTAMCLCKDDYHMVNETCVLNELQQQPMYIYALSNSLCDIEAKYSSSSFHNAPHNCFYSESDKRYRSLAYDYNSGAIYFSSATSDGTYSIEQTSVIANEQSYELITNTGEIQGIALDWVIGNLYWCDVTYNQIWMSSNDGRIQTILYTTENGTTPTAVTVDPIACKLYWIETDTQNNSQIIRANLDGSSREVFVEDDLVGPSGLAISYKNERLYFTNTDHEINGKKLEYVHLTGQNRAAQPVPFHIDYQPFDVDVLQDYVVFTDTQETQAGIRVVELGRGSDLNPQLIQQGQNESYDVLAYDSHNQPALPVGEHVGCGNNSCDEFCFNVQGDDLTYNCGCIVGKQLNVNGISCDIVSDLANTTTYILAMDEHLHGIYKINLNNNIQSSYSALGATPYDAPGAITWDGSNNTLYWTDKDAGNIKSAIYSGNDDLFVNILHNPEDGSNINGLFYDRASKLIYFTDATRNAISVIHELGGIKVIWDAEDNPDNAALVTGALAVDSQEGKLYFALGADIYRIHSNGEGDLALCNSDGGDGGGVVTTLAIDKQANALYWSTQGSNVIKKLSLVDLDDDSQTATPETISLGENASPKSFALSADKIFWSDVNQKGLFSIPRDSTSQDGVERWSDQVFRGLTTLIYVDTEEAVNSACGTNNGGCQEMCFPTINGISCGCSGGLTASPDTGICTDVVCSDDIPGGSWDSSCGREAFEFCAWSCDEGKVVASGPHHIICLAEHWSVNLDVLCTDPPSTCAPVLVGPNATVHCDNHANVSSQCTVTCDSGFEPQTPQTITCQESLLWSADLTECTPIPVTCRPPHMTSFTTRYTCDRHYNVGSQCTMSCIPGYVIPPNTPSHIMTCHVTGQWIGAEPFHCIRPVVTQPTPAPTSAHAGTSAATTSGMAASTAAQSPATSPRATPTPETATEKHSNFKDPTDDGSGKKNGLLIGMVLLAVVLVVIIIIIGFIAYRRSRSRGARYQRSEFMNDSVDYAAGEATPVYDSATGSVKLDNDTLTFDNPGYLSLSEQNGMNSDEMEPVTLKDSFDTPFESQNGAASQRTDANKNFENPLYINPQESDDTPEDFNQVRLVVE